MRGGDGNITMVVKNVDESESINLQWWDDNKNVWSNKINVEPRTAKRQSTYVGTAWRVTRDPAGTKELSWVLADDGRVQEVHVDFTPSNCSLTWTARPSTAAAAADGAQARAVGSPASPQSAATAGLRVGSPASPPSAATHRIPMVIRNVGDKGINAEFWDNSNSEWISLVKIPPGGITAAAESFFVGSKWRVTGPGDKELSWVLRGEGPQVINVNFTSVRSASVTVSNKVYFKQ